MPAYMEPFSVFRNFLALKLHFTENYNFLENHENLKSITYTKFENRSDSRIFIKLSTKLEKDDVIPFFVSQFSDRNIFNITDIVNDMNKSYNIYINWIKRIQNLEGLYKHDLTIISKAASGNWKNVFCSKNGDYPLIFKMVCAKDISPETYSCMNDLFNHASHVYSNFLEDDMFNNLNFRYVKYRYFLNITTDDILAITPRRLEDAK